MTQGPPPSRPIISALPRFVFTSGRLRQRKNQSKNPPRPAADISGVWLAPLSAFQPFQRRPPFVCLAVVIFRGSITRLVCVLFSYKVLDCILSEFHAVGQRHCYYRMEAILVPKEQPYYPQPAAGHTLSFFDSYAEKVGGSVAPPHFHL